MNLFFYIIWLITCVLILLPTSKLKFYIIEIRGLVYFLFGFTGYLCIQLNNDYLITLDDFCIAYIIGIVLFLIFSSIYYNKIKKDG